MERRGDWDARGAAFIASVRSKPHAYGSHDCLMFLAGAIQAVTGEDLARGHRGKYKSAASASRYLRSLGFETPEAFLDSILEQKPHGHAQRFDVVLASDGIPALCMGAFALSVGEEGGAEGLVKVPRSDWRKAWRVG